MTIPPILPIDDRRTWNPNCVSPRPHRVRCYCVQVPHSALRETVIATVGPSGALAMQLRDAATVISLDDDSELHR